mgnify:CR=1 FL=1
MTQNFNRFIHLVLQNNPTAISQRLVSMGMMQAVVDEPEQVRLALLEQVAVQSDGGAQLLQEALDVPLNPQGDFAPELQNLFNEIGNRSVLCFFLEEEEVLETHSATKDGISYYRKGELKFFATWMEVLGGVFVLLLTIRLFQSIFLTRSNDS